MFITEAKLRNIIKQVLVAAQLIEDDKSIEPVPEGWSVAQAIPTARINIDPFDWHGMHPDKIREILNSETGYTSKGFEEIDHDINSTLFNTLKPPVAKAENTDDDYVVLKAENHRLRKDLAGAEELLARKIEVIYNMEVDQDVQDEKLAELEGLLTRAQVVLEGLTSGDYFD